MMFLPQIAHIFLRLPLILSLFFIYGLIFDTNSFAQTAPVAPTTPAPSAPTNASTATPARTIKAQYLVTLLGLEIGQADFSLTYTAQTYLSDVEARLSGFATLIAKSQTHAEASGQVQNNAPIPQNYAISANNAQLTRTVRMALPHGDVKAVEIDPPIDDRSDRVPLRESDKVNILDPLTALLSLVMTAPTQSDGSLNRNICAPTLPVFDGFTRYDIHLLASGEKKIKSEIYMGNALICKARYVPISGHRPDRPATKFMAQNKEMEVWFVPIKSVAVPIKIAVLSMIGTITVSLTSIEVITEP